MVCPLVIAISTLLRYFVTETPEQPFGSCPKVIWILQRKLNDIHLMQEACKNSGTHRKIALLAYSRKHLSV